MSDKVTGPRIARQCFSVARVSFFPSCNCNQKNDAHQRCIR